jgi:hypothetical protein
MTKTPGEAADRAPEPESQYVVHSTDDWDSLTRWLDDWERLAPVALEPAPAAEHWMLLPALRHLAGAERVRVVVITVRRQVDGVPSETLCGVFPIVVRRMRGFGSTLVEFWHHIYAVSAIPLVARSEARGCIAAFLRWVRETMPSSALVRVPEVRIEGAFYACLREVLAREQIDSAFEDCWSRSWFCPARDAGHYLSALGNSHHRKEWRRLERRLGENGTVAYHELGLQGDVRGWLDEFMALEAAGWKGREGSAFASELSHAAWLKEIGIEAFARGRLMMLTLRRDGVAVAVKLNLLVDGGGYTFKIAYDERLERFSPGVLLELENIRRLHERANVAWMDSLAAPGHPLMERVWSGKAAFASMLIAPGRFAGRVLLAARPLLRLASHLAGVAPARDGKR